MTENKPSGIIIREIGNIINEQGETLIDLEIENEELKQENELLKIALCYTLDDMGSSYHVDLFEGVFNFNFDELMGRAYDIEWEELLKGDGENE